MDISNSYTGSAHIYDDEYDLVHVFLSKT